MRVFPTGFRGLQVRPSGQGRKEHHKPLCFVHVFKQRGEEPGTLEVKPLGAARSPGSRTLRGRRGDLAGTSSTGCSHPSGMPADGFSRRAWRRLGDFAAESGILRRRQRPRRWRRALQLHNAWHAPPGPPSQQGQAWGDAGSPRPLAGFQLMASLEARVLLGRKS